MSKKNKYFVKKESCVGCGACIHVCPQEAIFFQDDKVAIDSEKCNGCGECTLVCPFDAIEKINKTDKSDNS